MSVIQIVMQGIIHRFILFIAHKKIFRLNNHTRRGMSCK
jgi:hypothetical protein